MAALLAPWPFLSGGAASAVAVTTIFDGVTVEQGYLWRDGVVEARDPAGAVLVRLGADGFEVRLPCGCDGEAVVGERAVDVRELSLCGVTALSIGARTRVTLRVGAVTYVVAGTTAPRRLGLAPAGSWRRRAALAVTGLAGALCGLALQTATPRRASWQLSDGVRARVALVVPALHGGREPSSYGGLAPSLSSAARVTWEAPRMRTQATPLRPAPSPAATRTTASRPPRKASRSDGDPGGAAAALAGQMAQSVDDARRAAAVQARAAGLVGALAQSRVAFLGDRYVAASDVSDRGSVGLAGSRGDAQGAGAADGAASGTGEPGGALDGSETGEAYGVGGLGLAGSGAGGSGAGDDTIGLGDLGTLGYGGGEGSGVGYGSGEGRLGGRRARAPQVDVVAGSAMVRGRCDKELIRQVVRAHVNEVRFCYERVLQSRPTLTGRVLTQFTVAADGRVASSTVAASSLDDAVGQCVAVALRRWQFSPLCAGDVSYPFVFVPLNIWPQ